MPCLVEALCNACWKVGLGEQPEAVGRFIILIDEGRVARTLGFSL